MRSWGESALGECGHNMGGELNRGKVGKGYGRSRIWEKCGHNMGGDLNRRSCGDRGINQLWENLDIS